MRMKKIFFFAALAISATMTAQTIELDYYKTLVDEQADATKGSTQLYALDYAADGSLYALAMYQTASADETGLKFGDATYQGATASKWGSRDGDMKFTNMRNSFLAKLDAEGNVLWAKADTTGDYDLANTTIAVTNDGGVIYADKFRTRKGVYMSFFNAYDASGKLVATNSMSFTNNDSILVEGKNVKRKEAFSWAGIAVKDSFVYITGLQGDTLLPTWSDSIAPRKVWNTKGNLSQNCNTVILKYKVNLNTEKLVYVDAVINSDDLTYDRPLGLHYENGKLYVAGTYNNGTETGIYAARYDADLNREYVVYHPITGVLQFQQTKFADGKIFVCGGLVKGSITVGDKTLATNGNFNHGLIYIMSMEDGSLVNAAVRSAANDALNITVAAYPTSDGFVAYNHETLNGISAALNYDENMNLVSIDTLATGGGSSNVSVVGRSNDGNKTAVGLRARTTAAYNLLDEEPMNFASVTNWYSVIAVLSIEDQTEAIEEVQESKAQGTKVLRDGQLYILRDGKTYNVLGVSMQ